MLVEIKLMEDGKLPEYTRDGDACMDCYSAEDLIIQPNTRKLVKLGFALELPHGYECVIRPRSGMSKKGIDVAIGTIDENYRGEVMCNVINNSSEPAKIFFGDRICQIAIRRTEYIEWIEKDELDDSNRGADGFGSSGR